MSRYAILEQIQRLDPVRDCQRIVYLSTCYDFPFDTTRALEFALFRTFAVPAIAELLDRTGEFGHRAGKRYDDTDILISEIIEHGYASERGLRAIRRVNQLHGRFAIANEDFLYVLSTFIYEPIRWNERFGWRRLCEAERLGYFHFWREVGRRMGIRDIPEGYTLFERFNREYEGQHFRYSDASARVGTATRELFVSWFPMVPGPVVRAAIHALLDDPLREAFGFPGAPGWVRWLARAGLGARARLLRWLPCPDRPRLRTKMRRDLYPEGYTIVSVGPPRSS